MQRMLVSTASSRRTDGLMLRPAHQVVMLRRPELFRVKTAGYSAEQQLGEEPLVGELFLAGNGECFARNCMDRREA